MMRTSELSVEFRTALARILRRLRQGLLTESAAYHAVGQLFIQRLGRGD